MVPARHTAALCLLFETLKHTPTLKGTFTWPPLPCDQTFRWSWRWACVWGVVAVSSVTQQHTGSRFHSWFGAQGVAKTLVWNQISLRNPAQSRVLGKMDLYIIKRPHTHTHTHTQTHTPLAAPLHLQHSTGHTRIPYRVSQSSLALSGDKNGGLGAPLFTYGNSLSSEHLHSIPYLVSHGSCLHLRE